MDVKQLSTNQNIAMHASPNARKFFLVLVPTFQVHSPSFFPNPHTPFPTHCVGQKNKIGRLADRQKRLVAGFSVDSVQVLVLAGLCVDPVQV